MLEVDNGELNSEQNYEEISWTQRMGLEPFWVWVPVGPPDSGFQNLEDVGVFARLLIRGLYFETFSS